MKRIIIVALIVGLTGCQKSTSLTANKIRELSNEDLCRALGTYNNDGESVLNIYDELKRRPEKTDPEKCYILEKIQKSQHIEFNENIPAKHIPYTDDINTNLSYSNNNPYQDTAYQHHNIIHNPRRNDKSNKNNKIDINSLEKINSLNRMSKYKNEDYIRENLMFSTREKVADKIDIKEDEMGAIMRECLKKHISKPHVYSDE